jgi:hypothetical protein
MTKKDYVALARVLGRAKQLASTYPPETRVLLDRVIGDVADVMQDDNPKFQRTKFYDAIGTTTAWCLAVIVAASLALGAVLVAAPSPGAETCYYKSEQDSGMNRICTYSCLSGDAAITIKIPKLCPLSIQR